MGYLFWAKAVDAAYGSGELVSTVTTARQKSKQIQAGPGLKRSATFFRVALCDATRIVSVLSSWRVVAACVTRSSTPIPPLVHPRRFSRSPPAMEQETTTAVDAARKLKPAVSLVDESDQELRRQADLNESVPLEDLAQRVRADDTGSSAGSLSERNRQVFGIVWLNKTCQISPRNAIPRNRIYARYAEICARHKIKPLNPAAFGKLVKLVFPDIKTRRLGVRGKSKYHYCGINIIGDTLVPIGSINIQDNAPGVDDFDTGNDDSFETAHESTTSKVTAGGGRQKENQQPDTISPSEPVKNQTQPYTPDKKLHFEMPPTSPLEAFALPPLHFSKSVMDSPAVSFNALAFPSIDNFVPPSADKDAVDILTALCQSHCSALLESIRFMHLKQFLNTLASFHGTLTSPVQKLLIIPSILEWIQRCDWIMYKVSTSSITYEISANLYPRKWYIFLLL